MSKLLFNEQPLVIDKQLAKLIGLNEAMVLQQIHYWLEINRKADKNFREAQYWTYNTLEEWQEEFPFWSVDTVKRTLTKLRKMGILITGNFNRLKMDRTLWYTINYEELEKLSEIEKEEAQKNEETLIEEEEIQPVDDSKEEILNQEENNNQPEVQPKPLELSKSAKCPNASVQNPPMQECKMPSPIPEITTEITTEILNQSINPSDAIDEQTDVENERYSYNDIIIKSEADCIDERYRESVKHAIKLLCFDTENKKRIQIGENIIPTEIVRNDLRKLNFFMLEHAIYKFKEASKETRIRNTVSYLKSCIYNSIHEMNLDIDSELRHEGLI